MLRIVWEAGSTIARVYSLSIETFDEIDDEYIDFSTTK